VLCSRCKKAEFFVSVKKRLEKPKIGSWKILEIFGTKRVATLAGGEKINGNGQFLTDWLEQVD
jgi:hypothetical protein